MVTDVATTGYVQVVLGNAASTPVWFDDVQASAVQHIEKPVKTASAKASKNPNAPSVANRLAEPTCTQYTDTYYNTVTGEVLWVETYTVCPDMPGGSGGGDTGGGGGDTGGDGGGTGTNPTQCRACGYTPPPPPTAPLTEIYGECNGLRQALSTQAAQHKEVVGFVTTNGYVINFDTFTSLSSDNDFNLSFPLYDSQAHFVTSGSYQDIDGIWKIDINNYINGSRSLDTYALSYFFHTHPIGIDANGDPYDSNNPSKVDLANASKWPGVPKHIINVTNEIVYDSKGVISTSPNHCP